MAGRLFKGERMEGSFGTGGLNRVKMLLVRLVSSHASSPLTDADK